MQYIVHFKLRQSTTFSVFLVVKHFILSVTDIHEIGEEGTSQFTMMSQNYQSCSYYGLLTCVSVDQVWDMCSKPTLEYTINTIASVGRVKWRPQRKYHLASVALVVDCSVNIWDVRRPYIPFASFNEHKDVTTGIAWRGDPHMLLTTSRVSVHVFYFLSYTIV